MTWRAASSARAGSTTPTLSMDGERAGAVEAAPVDGQDNLPELWITWPELWITL